MCEGIELYLPEKDIIPASVISFVQSHPDASWFHLVALEKNCALLPGFSPFVICLQEKNTNVSGVICAFLIRSDEQNNLLHSISSIRIYGAPLISPRKETQEEILDKLLHGLSDFASLYTHCIEFWNDKETESLKSVFLSHGFLFSSHLNLIKSIPDKQTIWDSLSTSRRRQIRRASENGSAIREVKSSEEVVQLYHILKNLFANKIKKNIPSLETFINFYSTSKIAGQGVVLVVLIAEKVIGGIICPVLKNKIMYEWYICGQDKEYPKNFPSVMATWAGLVYAADNNIPAFNFLGLGKPETPYGVRDFKLRFSGDVVNFGRYTKTL